MSKLGVWKKLGLRDLSVQCNCSWRGVQTDMSWSWGQSQPLSLKWEEGLILLLGWF